MSAVDFFSERSAARSNNGGMRNASLKRIGVSLALLVLGLPSTGCDHFAEVPRPAPGADVVDPEGILSVWYDDTYYEYAVGAYNNAWQHTEKFDHHVAIPNKTYWVVGAGKDDGGLRELSTALKVWVTCHHPWTVFEPWADIYFVNAEFLEDTRLAPNPSAPQGEMVPDGLWIGLPFRPSNYLDSCGTDELIRVEGFFDVEVEDFSGNESTFGWGTIIYEP